MRNVNSAWIGLIGVVVGGVITTIWSWAAVVRNELGDAIVAARLVDENLAALQVQDGTQNREVWEANRAALARALGQRQWAAVSVVYQTSDLPTERNIALARDALRSAVAGKRYLTSQRIGNIVARSPEQ